MLSHLAGIFGCIIAIFLFCRVCPTNDIDFDYIGAIVGILAIFVTLLVAWNIYSAIGVEQKVYKALHNLEQNEKKAKDEKEKQNEFLDAFKCGINSEIESFRVSTTANIELLTDVSESYRHAYIALFNATQAQLSEINDDKDYLQRYSHYQTALNALLKCSHFPSDIKHNINVLLAGMENSINMLTNHAKDTSEECYKLYKEDREEFLKDMDEISKSTREELSFELKLRFMNISGKAKELFEKLSN